MQNRKLYTWAAYIGCYLLLLLLIVLGGATLFIWRWTLIVLLPIIIPRSPWQPVIYGTVLILLGIALFILALVAEYQLRTGVPRGQVLGRFMRFALPMAGVLVLGLFLQWLSTGQLLL